MTKIAAFSQNLILAFNGDLDSNQFVQYSGIRNRSAK